jgi:hypothetical protein
MGLEGETSLRKQFDGFTYFGCKKSVKKNIPTKTTANQMGATGTSVDDG